ncbi:MAG: nitroreductase family protein [Actinobacteria bacterium]|nr:nitroreductase family protein [Actinomycetota bacterium]
MDAIEAIMTRRSVRHFTRQPVTDAELETVLRAAMAAPSAHNQRPWRFVAVRDRATLDRLATATMWATPVGRAQAAIVVYSERIALRAPGFWSIDCAAAIQNLLLAAHAGGLGAVWIGVYPITPFRRAVRKVLGLPATAAVHSMVALGHPERTPEPVDRWNPDWVRNV